MILDERTLPKFLQKDLQALQKALDEEDYRLIDCLWSEVYGSINSAYYGNEINKDIADYLRKKYLGL